MKNSRRGGKDGDRDDHGQKLGKDGKDQPCHRSGGKSLVDEKVHDQKGLLGQDQDHQNEKPDNEGRDQLPENITGKNAH